MDIKEINIDIGKINKDTLKTVYLEVFFNEIKLSTATGFILRESEKYYLVTNRHVVTGRNAFTNECIKKETGAIPNSLIVHLNFLITENKKKRFWANPFNIPLYDELDNIKWLELPKERKVDIGIIDLTNMINTVILNLKNMLNASNVQIFSYNYKDLNIEHKKVGQEVNVVGYPFGLTTITNGYFPAFTRGTISSEWDLNLNVPLDEECKNRILANAFLIDARTRMGQSGSPVITFDKSHYLLGVYSGRVDKESDLGYVWKSELIKEIIEGSRMETID